MSLLGFECEPGIRKELERMIESVCVVGAGRVGQAVEARLRGQVASVWTTGRELACDGADLVLLCVPDRAISEVARAVPRRPWVAHVSGATPLSALEPHARRFSLHPLQTFQAGLGPEQLDGAYAAITAETPGALGAALELADLLGLRAFEVADEDRPAYHAAATMAATFLVTLHDAAAGLMESAGAPPEALTPLMRRTIDNDFLPTGPFVRNDHETVEAHLRAIRARRPALEPLYLALADVTQRLLLR
jgi:predicted short-subunit dehydrogenase-like oxidoreductase (DUF2520 family)